MNVQVVLGSLILLGILMSLGNWHIKGWNMGAVVFGIIAIGFIIYQVIKGKKKK